MPHTSRSQYYRDELGLTRKIAFVVLLVSGLGSGSLAQDVLSPDYGRPQANVRPGTTKPANVLTGAKHPLRRTSSNAHATAYDSTDRIKPESAVVFADDPREKVFGDDLAAIREDASTEIEPVPMAPMRTSSANAPQPPSILPEVPIEETSQDLDKMRPSKQPPSDNQQVTGEEAVPPQVILSPRNSGGEFNRKRDHARSFTRFSMPWGSLTSVLFSLGIVLALFFSAAWLFRRGVPGAIPTLPKEVLEVLGRSPLGGRQQIQLLRLGSKLILVHVTPSGIEPITEIVEPAEVDRIAGLCQQNQSSSSTRNFRDLLDQMNNESITSGILERDHGLELTSASRRRGQTDRERSQFA